MADCPNCEYHKNRAARWRAEAYKQAGHDVIELPWVGLTDEDVREVSYDFPPSIAEWYDKDFARFIHALEAKLKEKNT